MTPLEAYTANIARLDALADQGLNDSPEADAIRDEMDGQWAEMTEAERARHQTYSERLASQRRVETLEQICELECRIASLLGRKTSHLIREF